MGYETTIHVVMGANHFDWHITHDNKNYYVDTGIWVASIELSKFDYDGVLAKLIKDTKPKEPKYALFAENPERQNEAVEFIREVIEDGDYKTDDEERKRLTGLVDDIEDGFILTDKYGDFIGGIPFDQFLTTLRKELETNPATRLVWAEALLSAIAASKANTNTFNVLTYGH